MIPLTRHEAAAELGIGKSRLGRMIDEGLLEVTPEGITRESVEEEKRRRAVRDAVHGLRDHVTIPLAAKLCGVTEGRIRFLISDGKLSAMRTDGITWIDGDSLLDWIDHQDNHPRSARNRK